SLPIWFRGGSRAPPPRREDRRADNCGLFRLSCLGSSVTVLSQDFGDRLVEWLVAAGGVECMGAGEAVADEDGCVVAGSEDGGGCAGVGAAEADVGVADGDGAVGGDGGGGDVEG